MVIRIGNVILDLSVVSFKKSITCSVRIYD